jgi:uncharacterized membrane protein
MSTSRPRAPAVLGIVAASLGLFFAAFSTHDYAQNLDRQLHTPHCSFVPGLVASDEAKGCLAAMYSPYSSLFREKYWGGIPISLFAVGAYAFFLALAVYVLTAGNAGSKRAWQAFGLTALTPLFPSAVMFFITITKLHEFCKLCVGMYTASALLAVAGVWALKASAGAKGPDATDTLRDPIPPFASASTSQVPPGYPAPAYAVDTLPVPAPAPFPGWAPIPTGGFAIIPSLFVLLGLFALAPAYIYVSSLPDYKTYLTSCGKLLEATEKHGALVHLPTTQPVQPALVFEDPLCPTCRAFHERLVTDGIYDKLDLTVAIFPLDSDCNWMLDKSLHPGACVLAKAFLCGGDKSRQILEWSYENQDSLRDAGKAGKDMIRAKVKERFPDVDACIDAKETQKRLDRVLHFAVANKVPISTPQLFLGDTRVCDEDTDLGLRYTLGQLSPQLNTP